MLKIRHYAKPQNVVCNLKKRQPLKKLTLRTCLNLTLATGQTYSSVASDQEIYEFLNWMTINDRKYQKEPKLKRKHIYCKILSWDTKKQNNAHIVHLYRDKFGRLHCKAE